MKHESITKEGQETAALYALGALSQFEARAFDVHLREGCPACDLELKQFDGVVGLLGAAAEPVAPSGYVRDLLSVRIQREVSETPKPEKSKPATPVIPFPEQPGVSHIHSSAGSTAKRSWLPWAVAAAFLLAFVVSFVAWRTSRNALQARIDRMEEWASALVLEDNGLREELIERVEIDSVLKSTSRRIIQLTGQEPSLRSTATVYWEVEANRWVVTAELPPAPEGKVYQLWFVTAQAKISAGLIHSNRRGHGFAILQFPPDIGPLAAAAITLEPDGGSEQPTMPIFVMGDVMGDAS